MRSVVPIVCAFVWIGLPAAARAYRPFDSTDAAVADEGALEIELGPAGFVKTGPDRFLVAPTVILNVGVRHDWELVLEGRHFVLLDPAPGEARFRLEDTGLSLKLVLRDGTLQGGTGPSVATEIGALLPTVRDEPGVGAVATGIVSQRSEPVTLHLNTGAAITRAHNPDLFAGLIIEGPQRWAVRPVAEGVVEHEFGVASLVSGLVGAIWRARESLSFDVAARLAREADANTFELRAGLTWDTALWRTR